MQKAIIKPNSGMRLAVRALAGMSFILTACLLLGSAQTSQKTRPAEAPTAALIEDNLSKELIRIQLQLDRLAQDLESADAQMIIGDKTPTTEGSPRVFSEAHELIKGFEAIGTVKAFFENSGEGKRWELCLKTAKLYRGLAEKTFQSERELKANWAKPQSKETAASQYSYLVQLLFLARTATELQLRYSEFQSFLMAAPNPKQQDMWRGLRQAVENDDRTFRARLTQQLAEAGISPPQFAEKTLQGLRQTNPAAASALVEGLTVISREGDIWKLSSIDGINPNFIAALECDRRAVKTFLTTGSNTALEEIRNCRKNSDGTLVLAFESKSASINPANHSELAGKAQPDFRELASHPEIYRSPSGEVIHDPLKPDQGGSTLDASNPPKDDQGSGFGATFKAVPQPKIPSWWIRCMCPSDHPDAGMVVNGVRWHAPVLQCPNPELKRWEVK